MKFITPLRYPGGKGKLGAWIAWTMRSNKISGGTYAEPYAGGAGAALYLLMNEYVKKIMLNDVDPVIYSFWWSILNDTERFIQKLERTPINLEERERCRGIIANIDEYDRTDIGFACFFLNRVNRSGIIKGGVIGGMQQEGECLMDARFNKADLIRRVSEIAKNNDRIEVSCLDALEFIELYKKSADERSLIYLDPPYYEKAEQLYRNYYVAEDHKQIADAVAKLTTPWLVTYDNHDFIKSIYKEYNCREFSLIYSTNNTRPQAKELLFYNGIALPADPVLTKTPYPYPAKWDKGSLKVA